MNYHISNISIFETIFFLHRCIFLHNLNRKIVWLELLKKKKWRMQGLCQMVCQIDHWRPNQMFKLCQLCLFSFGINLHQKSDMATISAGKHQRSDKALKIKWKVSWFFFKEIHFHTYFEYFFDENFPVNRFEYVKPY